MDFYECALKNLDNIHVLVIIFTLMLGSCYRINSPKDQDVDMAMIEQLREAVDLLQDPNRYVCLSLAQVSCEYIISALKISVHTVWAHSNHQKKSFYKIHKLKSHTSGVIEIVSPSFLPLNESYSPS